MHINWRKKKQESTQKHHVAGVVGIYTTYEGTALAHVLPGENKPILQKLAWLPQLENTCDLEFAQKIKELSLVNAPCVYVLSPDKYQMLLMEQPDAPQETWLSTIQSHVEGYIDFPLKEAMIDYIELPCVNSDNKKMMYAVIIKQELVSSILGCITKAGLAVEAVDISETALRNIAQFLPENAEGHAFLELSPYQNLLVVLKDKQIHMCRNLEVNVSDFFSHEPGTDKTVDAEHLKKTFHDLALEIQRSVDYCSSSLHSSVGKNLVVAPIGGQEKNFVENAKDMTEHTMRMMELSEVFVLAEDFPVVLQNKCLYAIGGAMRGLKATDDETTG